MHLNKQNELEPGGEHEKDEKMYTEHIEEEKPQHVLA